MRPFQFLATTATLALLATAPAHAEPRVLVYGDSNSWGWIPVETGFPATRHPDALRWPGVMERALEAQLGEVTVVVDALSGRTVASAYPQAQNGISGDAFSGLDDIRGAVAAALPLDLVVVMLGTNDARSDLDLAPSDVGADMARLVAEIRALNGGVASAYDTPQVLVVAPPAMGDTSATPIGGVTQNATARSRAVNDALIAAGAEAGFQVFDASGSVTVDSIDGVHLTVPMHDTLGRAVAQPVAALLNGQ